MEQGTDMLQSNDAGAVPTAPASRLAGFRARRQLVADGALLLVTLVWGATFVMVKDAVTGFPVFSFMVLRFALAALALAPLALWQSRRSPVALGRPRRTSSTNWRGLLFASALTGFALFAGYAFQTAGLKLTTPAKAGFITGLSVAIVPVISALLLRQSPSRNAWIGVGMATLGLALLSLTADLNIQTGDLLVMACAFSYAAHILLLGHFAPRHDAILLTLGQVTAVALFSGVAALIFDDPTPLTGQVLFAAAFTGILATAVAFGVQTVAQRFTTATHTALIFAAEPVFAGLFSLLLIGETLGPRQLLGCALILGGMLVAELKRK
jgi:drug/metabolite transporter (DMT)-like permease